MLLLAHQAYSMVMHKLLYKRLPDWLTQGVVA